MYLLPCEDTVLTLTPHFPTPKEATLGVPYWKQREFGSCRQTLWCFDLVLSNLYNYQKYSFTDCT